MKKTILVVGGTGFIGKNFITTLIKKKKFNIFSLSKTKLSKKLCVKGIKYIFCDIKKKNQLKKKLNFSVDYVVNFSGHINHKEKKKTYETHFLGAKNLIDIFLKRKIKKFIQIGSSVEYGFLKSPHDEKNNLDIEDLRSTYGRSKLSSTKYVIKCYKKNNFPGLVIRPYLIYGPGQSHQRLIPTTIINCLKNNSFNCSSGKQIRNFMFVDDFSKILYKCLFLKISGEIFNIGSSKNYKVKFIINKINQLIGKGSPRYNKIKLRKDEPLNLYPKLKKIKRYIKFKRATKIEFGLKKTIFYYKKSYNEKNLFN